MLFMRMDCKNCSDLPKKVVNTNHIDTYKIKSQTP